LKINSILTHRKDFKKEQSVSSFQVDLNKGVVYGINQKEFVNKDVEVVERNTTPTIYVL